MEKPKSTSWVARRIEAWSEKRNPPADEVILNRKNILIIPSSQGVLLALAILVVLIAAINYENSLGFGLAFMMVSLFLVAMLHGFNNLNGLRLSTMPCSPVFCGEDAAFQIVLSSDDTGSPESLELLFRGSRVSRAGMSRATEEQVSVFLPASRRGELAAPKLYVRSRFPTGLFSTWSIVNLQTHCLVYPRPVAVSLKEVLHGASSGVESKLVRSGTDDFHGFRSFVPGDSLKQVAWKNVARGQGMLVKQFIEPVDEQLWLDWDMFFGFSQEERLSRLCYCVLQMASLGATFGVKLPGIEISPAAGKKHKIKVLRALALFNLPDTESPPSDIKRG